MEVDANVVVDNLTKQIAGLSLENAKKEAYIKQLENQLAEKKG